MAEMHEDTGLQIHVDMALKRHPLLEAWDTAEKNQSSNAKKIFLCRSMQHSDENIVKREGSSLRGLLLRDTEEDAPHAMLMLTRFVSLFRVFTIEISLHRKIDNDFVNGCLFGCTQLFKCKEGKEEDNLKGG